MHRKFHILIITIIFCGFVTFFISSYSQEVQDSRDKVRKQGLLLVQIYKLLGAEAVVRHDALLGERR
ncbi:MAG: hypothetical protein CBC01_06850 [Betaproteobacteria bacterium TMED41]|nr:MAG: hypothetical protein CBC01_06850 [Betaproteobacteria bacterium TMED41]